MGWSEKVAAQWPQHRFAKARWDLLPVAAEDSVAFLHSLDLFIYDTGPHIRESWGRAVVEAMLCGAVPLVPKGGGHHLEHLVPHGIGGFHCATREEFGERARQLEADPGLRHRMARDGRTWAVKNL